MSFQRIDLNDRKRPGGRNVVILYGFSAIETDLLKGAAKESGIDEWLYLDKTRKDMVIKDILDRIDNNEQVTYKKEKDQVILFNGTSQYELQQFISRQKGFLKEQPLIAMVTKNSIEWKFNMLIGELKEER